MVFARDPPAQMFRSVGERNALQRLQNIQSLLTGKEFTSCARRLGSVRQVTKPDGRCTLSMASPQRTISKLDSVLRYSGEQAISTAIPRPGAIYHRHGIGRYCFVTHPQSSQPVYNQSLFNPASIAASIVLKCPLWSRRSLTDTPMTPPTRLSLETVKMSQKGALAIAHLFAISHPSTAAWRTVNASH